MAWPSGAQAIGGMAVSQDGALYVTLGGTVAAATNFSAAVGFADGTAAAPSIAWTSDQDGTGTGLYRRTANAISFSLNGTGSAEMQIGYSLIAPALYNISWTNGAIAGSSVTSMSAAGMTNGIRYGGSDAASSTVTSRTEINKAITAFTNAVAKATFTVTVPNAAHNATLRFTVNGALGAGGAIGAGSAMATNTYMIGIVRTAGVATVATATAATQAVAVAVAGSETVTATAAVSAMSGAVGVAQTFTIDVTITRSTGSSDNHTAQVFGELLNANAAGITLA